MPANKLDGIEIDACFHIYNKGIENKIIFNDDQDYEVFLAYLKSYLTPSLDPETTKQTFVVNGRTFRGTPHQPKNYFNRVELIAYSLVANHFHLILRQKASGAIQSFIRSLCTRYSIYFNKKYHRTGALFEGPYRSKNIKDQQSMLLLIHYLHQIENYSSHKYYIGLDNATWVSPKTGYLNESYKDFIEKNSLVQVEKQLLESVNFEEGNSHFEKTVVQNETPKDLHIEEKKQQTLSKSSLRIPEFLGAAFIFVILTVFGIRNINAEDASINKVLPTMTPAIQVLGIVAPSPIATSSADPIAPILALLTPIPSPTPIPEPTISPNAKTLIVKITDGSPTVNIRKEASIESDVVGKAKNGQVFEYTTVDSGWYRVVLEDGAGYISPMYVKVLKTTKQ